MATVESGRYRSFEDIRISTNPTAKPRIAATNLHLNVVNTISSRRYCFAAKVTHSGFLTCASAADGKSIFSKCQRLDLAAKASAAVCRLMVLGINRARRRRSRPNASRIAPSC